MEMKAIDVIFLPSKEILIVFSVRGSYLEDCALIRPLALTKKTFFLSGGTKYNTKLIIFILLL